MTALRAALWITLGSSRVSALVLPKHQQSYRWNFRPNALYIVDCESGSSLECQEYCTSNQILDSNDHPLYSSKPELEDWLDSWPDDCVFNLTAKESLNTISSGILRHKTGRYGGYNKPLPAEQGFYSHTLFIEPSGSQNNALFSYIDRLEIKLVANVGSQTLEPAIGNLDTQICLVASGVESHFATDCLYENLSAMDTDYAILPGKANLTVWPNVRNWKSEDYFVDEDTTSDYRPASPGDRRLNYSSTQLVTNLKISMNNQKLSENTLSEEFESKPFGTRYYDSRSSIGGWSDFLNPLDSSNWLDGSNQYVSDSKKIPGRAFSMTITIPLSKATMAKWSGTLQIVKTKMTIYSKADYKVKTGGRSEILPWYDTYHFSSQNSDLETPKCPDKMYTCKVTDKLLRHDSWFDPQIKFEQDVFYSDRKYRCARDPLSCPGTVTDDLFKNLTSKLSFYMPPRSLARVKSL